MNYTFQKKREISRRIADVSRIEDYRAMLRSAGNPAATKKMMDRKDLAVALVYELLSSFSESEIVGRNRPMAAAPVVQTQAPINVQSPKRRTKFDEYPNIRWKEMENTLVRTADSIYSDRVNLYHSLKELEQAVNGSEAAEQEQLAEIVEKSVRLELCFDELRSFDRTGEFIGKHPFISQHSERERVLALLKENPDKYFEERKNIELNITRYSSQIKSKKISEEEKLRAKDNLERFKISLAMYKELFNEYLKQ